MNSKKPNDGQYVFKERYGRKMYWCPLCGMINGENEKCIKCGAFLVKKPFPMKKFLIISIIAIIPIFYFAYGRATGNCIKDLHLQLSKATCTNDSVCLVCGKVLEEANGHTYPQNAADCAENIYCAVCGERRPALAEHQWTAANCYNPARCSVCGLETGSPTEHQYVNGTCKICKNTTFGVWSKKYFVDEYGDKTKIPYIYGEFGGTFSNSAVTNRNADGYWIITKDSVSIVIYKYGDTRLKGSSYETRFYNIKIKTESGVEQGLDGTLRKNDDRITIESYQNSWVTNILKKGGQIKILIQGAYDPYKDEKYVFTMDDTSGFSNIYNRTF